MKRIYLLIIIALSALQGTLAGENIELSDKHSVRIGWGEMALDRTLCWWSEKGLSTEAQVWQTQLGMTAGEADTYMRNARYATKSEIHTSGHIFAEYQYRVNQCVGVGAELDYLGTWKNYTEYDGYGHWTRNYRDGANYWSIIPKVRFTYMRREHIRMYSSIGLGMTIRSDLNPRGCGYKRMPSDVSGTFDLTFWGFSAGGEHVYGSFELGTTSSFGPETGITMVLTRLMRFGIGYRF